MKVCGKCKIRKRDSDFKPRGQSRCDLSCYCIPCKRKHDRDWNRSVKIEAFERYGGAKCTCCGIEEISFLSLDHVDTDGSNHRKKSKCGTGSRMYKWLKSHRWPSVSLQVLCHNCNMGRYINGVCPHKLPNGVTGNMLGSEPRDL